MVKFPGGSSFYGAEWIENDISSLDNKTQIKKHLKKSLKGETKNKESKKQRKELTIFSRPQFDDDDLREYMAAAKRSKSYDKIVHLI